MPGRGERTAGQASLVADPINGEFENHRRALTGYCYRMLGSGFEAEDAVQETMVRAWRGSDNLHSPGALRSWLYRIATNVCLSMLTEPQRRARPMGLGPSSTADSELDAGLPEQAWVSPIQDDRVLCAEGDPAELAVSRESIRLAFVAALQHLPPRQRAVLILREVLRWRAAEVAELLDTTVASVNSALQRARATLETVEPDNTGPMPEAEQRALLDGYVTAFQNYDIDALVQLLHADVRFSMPPYALWLRGPDQVVAWLLGQGAGCRGSRLVATSANGCAAFGSYRSAGPGRHEPFALQVLEFADGRIAGFNNFLDPRLFAAFGLPPVLTE
ncbi:MAG TPA: sigma-70 family RNA polymerase sigma factor [Pseudonocardiaceae bacterium]|jgi:RNA polymerase sigma-70 factor (ECF subfamily)|nr:sigma-70 family RNA polymerase sigma factor [Pseudonocardiaceae bacterium]